MISKLISYSMDGFVHGTHQPDDKFSISLGKSQVFLGQTAKILKKSHPTDYMFIFFLVDIVCVYIHVFLHLSYTKYVLISTPNLVNPNIYYWLVIYIYIYIYYVYVLTIIHHYILMINHPIIIIIIVLCLIII